MLVLPYTHGRYRLIERIAQGGMAEIYRAEYHGDGGFVRTVAVKRILPQWSQDRLFSKMLQDEAKLLVKLQHQNIVQVFELGEDNGVFYISMEHVDGVDLRTLLQTLRCRCEKLPPKFVYWIVSDVLRALAFAHGRIANDGSPLMVVHRDVSPQNILLAKHGDVKVADFGIAKGRHRSEETAVGQLKGKLAYMSPEQAQGEAIDSRSDLFSLGIVFYEMLTGTQLFEGDSDLKVLQKVQEAVIPPGWEHDVAPEIRAILRRCLKKNPDDRFQTAEEMLAALSHYTIKHRCQIFGFEFAPYIQALFPEQPKPAHAIERCSQNTIVEQVVTSGGARFRQYFYGAATLCAAFVITPQAPQVMDANATVVATPLQSAAIVAPPLPPQLPIPTPVVPVSPPLEPSRSKGKLSVQVRPWGYVTIPGAVTRKEAPVGLALVEGNYQVKVFHEPTAQWLTARATVKPGAHTHCQASFAATPRISCK